MQVQVLSFAQVKESNPGESSRAVLGAAVVKDGDVLALPFPLDGAATLENGDLWIRFTPVATPPKGVLPPTSWRVLAKLAPHVKRPHKVGKATYDDPRARQRAYLAALEAFAGMATDEKAGPHWIRAAAEVALGTFGLKLKHAATREVLDALLPGSHMTEDEILSIFEEVEQAGVTCHEFNARGRAIDAGAAEDERRAKEAREAARAKRDVEEAQNEATVGDLNVLAFVVSKLSMALAPPQITSWIWAGLNRGRAVLQDDASYYLLFSRAPLVGARFPEGEIVSGVTVASSDVVIPGTHAGVRAAIVHDVDATLRQWLFVSLRAKVSRQPCTGTWDHATAEGSARIEQAKGATEAANLIAQVVGGARSVSPGSHFAKELLFSTWRDGFEIAPDVIAEELHARFAAAWRAAHDPDREAYESRERSRLADAQMGRLHAVTHAVGRSAVTFVKDDADKKYEAISKEYSDFEVTPYRIPPPPARFTVKGILEDLKTSPALFVAGELFVPDEGMITRIAAALGADPFKPAIAELVATRDEVRSAEIEEKLGAVASTPQARSRIFRIMTKLGFVKRKVRRDGAPTKVFVRAGASA